MGAGAATFALPIAPHALLLLWKTGNPVFPYFNEIFASPYFPVWNIKDNRWGPGSGTRALVWPLLSAFRPGRFSEFATTTGRLALGWVVSVAALVFFRRDERLRSISVIVLFGGLFWSLGTGYQRYGLFCELLGGLLLALVAARLAGLPAFVADDPAEPSPARWRQATAALLVLVATAQSAWAVRLVLRADWSDRPTVFHALGKSAAEASLLFRDRDLTSFLSAGARERISRPLVWVDAAPKANGIMTLLAPAAPMIGLQVEAFIASRPNLKKLDGALRACRGRAAYSLAFRQDADAAQQTLFRLGFPVASRTPVSFPFFSTSRPIDLVLFEVALPPPLDSGFDAKVPTPWGMDTSLRGSIDEPVNGQEVNGDLLVRGWAREPGEDLLVTVLVGGVAVAPRSYRRVPRPDVAAVLPALGDCRWAGYEVVVPRPVAAPREVDVSVVFHSRSGRSRHYPGVRIRWERGGAPTRGSSSG